MRENMYLRDRAMRRRMRDSRNPYGSRGGYVAGSRSRDRAYSDYARSDYNMNDYRNDYNRPRYDYGYNNPTRYDGYNVMPPYSYDYGYPSYDYDYASEEKSYDEELHKWIEKLKKYDRFGWNKEQVIEQAKKMGVSFDKYDENEYFATYLMLMSDFPKIANEPHTYLSMAKEWLEDQDAYKKNSEKLCCYLYEIVLGKEKED